MSAAEEDHPVGGTLEDALSRLRLDSAIASSIRHDESVTVEVAHAGEHALRALFHRALVGARHQRGGALLMASILDNQPIDEVFDVALSLGALFVARDGDEPVGLALVREGTVEAVYVIESHRRRGVARALLNAVMGARREVLDAYALPGDRATKSLYESFGWKARLLTMRAE